MGMQYMDVIHQNEKLRKKNKELELKNASLMKETNMMRERQDDLLRKIDRLERNEKKRNNRNDMVDMFALVKFSQMMSTLGVNADELDTATLTKIMLGSTI